jgi:DNA-binding transcriptional LysR family regulator
MDVEARLRAFAAFARHLSFSAAARELYISQPAVSRHIADVERSARVKLVERQPRGAVLTPAGTYLADHVLRAQALLAQAARGVAEYRQAATGSLSIVASGIPGTYLLPEVVAEFNRKHPGVRVKLELATSARAVESLRAHRSEVGVVGGFVAAPEIDATPLVEDEIIVIASRGLARRRMSRRQLESATWISREEGSGSRAAVEAAWANAGINPSHLLELPSWEAVKLAVAHGHGVAGCSQFAVQDELRAGTLGVVRLRGWNVRRTISIVQLKGTTLTQPAQEFLELLRLRWGRPPKRRRLSDAARV